MIGLYTWDLPEAEYQAYFGHSLSEYVPERDPEDEDDFQAEYSMWRTSDRALLQDFRDLNDLIVESGYDLQAFGPGEFTIKHCPTGAVWDVPDFVAQHEQIVAAAGNYDEEEGAAE